MAPLFLVFSLTICVAALASNASRDDVSFSKLQV
jgi:hypothetical protein